MKYLFYRVSMIRDLIKDLVWEDLSVEEIRMNYLFGKANAFDRAHLLDQSMKVYEAILEKTPNSIPVLLNLGGISYRRGLYKKAISYYERVIRGNPKHYHAHYWLARCFWTLQRYYAAINTLEEVIEYLPTFKDALNLIGECYERIGESAKAEHFYLKAISVDPGSVIAQGSFLDRLPMEKGSEARIKH